MNTFAVSSLVSRNSNGYLEHVFRRAAADMFNVHINTEQKLTYTQGKNRHYQEVTFPGVPLKFVQSYGFQHIQNIIRKLKTRKCDFQYVELMACPSGCTNGGGQIKKEQYENPPEASLILERVEGSLHDMKDRELKTPIDMQALIAELDTYGPEWRTAEFHPVDESDPMRQATAKLQW